MTEKQSKIFGYLGSALSILMYVSYIPQIMGNLNGKAMQKPIRILGIDPGSRVTGFGVIDVLGQSHCYVASGCIKTIPGDELAGRIGIIVQHIGEIIDTYRPNQAAVEQVEVGKTKSFTQVLSYARIAPYSDLFEQGTLWKR